ncbi:MAG: PASTA domain-containing protein [Firmicutes bacterium]|nr:PASTA domain-containing protein [Bacillota bacterium]
MSKIGIGAKRRIFFMNICMLLGCGFMLVRVAWLMSGAGGELVKRAYDNQTRDRLISPRRGNITDRNGTVLAGTQTAAAISVIHAQVVDEERTARELSQALGLDYGEVLEKVQKRVALVRIKDKVDAETAESIRALGLDGVMIDEDIKRVYPFGETAAQVLGFVGRDNQGVTGLEARYDSILRGEKGRLMTYTKANGTEIPNLPGQRQAPKNGCDLITTIDVNIQRYAEQLIKNTVTVKQAKSGLIIVMDPRNGEIYAMANYPSFDPNDPYTIDTALWGDTGAKSKNDALNRMWRNFAINDTYEPGSTFKVVTSAAGLEEKVVHPNDTFECNAGRNVADRRIKCWRAPRSHGTQTFVQGVQNSCNPVFIDVAARLGGERFYDYMIKYGFDKKTGVDLPGEAVGIMHKREDITPLDTAVMSFGQGFQITPLQLVCAVAATVNGGTRITPHFARAVKGGDKTSDIVYGAGERIISAETSDTMRGILESVVASGTGSKTYIPGMRIGGKTATSQKLPRGSGKYIASFCAFAPAESPRAIALVLINEPQGVYYGGQVAGPVMQQLLGNILPYMGISASYNDTESKFAPVRAENYIGMTVGEAKQRLEKQKINVQTVGDGDVVTAQLPAPDEFINPESKIILYTKQGQ